MTFFAKNLFNQEKNNYFKNNYFSLSENNHNFTL